PALNDWLRRRHEGVLVQRAGGLDYYLGYPAAVLAGDRQGAGKRGSTVAARKGLVGRVAVIQLLSRLKRTRLRSVVRSAASLLASHFRAATDPGAIHPSWPQTPTAESSRSQEFWR